MKTRSVTPPGIAKRFDGPGIAGRFPARGISRFLTCLFATTTLLLAVSVYGKTIEVPSAAVYIIDPKSSEILWKNYEFHAPMEVRALSDNLFLVCDYQLGRVIEIDRAGEIRWETAGNNAEDAKRLKGGGTLVVNNGNSEIHLVDRRGRIYRTYREGLDHPTSAILTASDTLVVADARNKRIVELDARGAQLRENAQLSNPRSLEALGDGSFLITDANLHRVYRLDRNWRLEPIAEGFQHPSNAKRLPNGNIVVADTGNNRLVEVDRSGIPLRTIQFDQAPRSVDILSDGTWVVALTYEERPLEGNGRSTKEPVSSSDPETLSIPAPVSSFQERNRYAHAATLLICVVGIWLVFEIRRRPPKSGEGI